MKVLGKNWREKERDWNEAEAEAEAETETEKKRVRVVRKLGGKENSWVLKVFL